MKGEGKYTETFGVSAQIGEIYRRCQDISSNQGDIQKVSGYLPKSGRYTESFRIISSSTRTEYKCYPMGTLHPPSSVEQLRWNRHATNSREVNRTTN